MENNEAENEFNETYSKKYNKWNCIFKKLLIINFCICIIIIISFIFKLHNSLNFIINYTFFSMCIFHITGIIICLVYLNDFNKCKNGEAIYLKKYYPEIWIKINPYGDIIIKMEYLKYHFGKYIKKDGDKIIEKIKNDKKNLVFIYPLFLIFILIGLAIIGI